jgi:hypothetical protein
MYNIKDKITIIVLSCFGIGFIPYVSGILASVLASLIIFLPIPIKEEILLISIFIIIIIFIPLNHYFTIKMKGEQRINVLSKVIGTWLVLSSPVIVYSTSWIITSLLLFLVLSYSRTNLDNFLLHKTEIWNKLTKDLLAGAVAFIVLHAFYAGYLIYPFISAFLQK